MPNKLTDNEIIKEIQDIRESMKRHIDLTNEMGQDLLRIDEEYTGGSKVWLTTDYFQKVVKHFSHSNYLVKCLELVFDYINRLQAENERLKSGYKNDKSLTDYFSDLVKQQKDTIDKQEAEIKRLKEKIERLQSICLRFLEEMSKWGNKNNVDTTNFSMIPIFESEKESFVKQIKAEAYKECVEKAKNEIDTQPHSRSLEASRERFRIHIILNNLLKELVGEDNESKN